LYSKKQGSQAHGKSDKIPEDFSERNDEETGRGGEGEINL
jgi:hypothetical protein